VTQLDRADADFVAAAFETVLTARAIHSVYQPIVDLESGETVAYEALARGPSGTTWVKPEVLVSYAERVHRLPELDWVCRAAACRGALNAGLPAGFPLFVNVEPASWRSPCPPDLARVLDAAAEQLEIVVEVTERSLATDPAGLLETVERLRGQATRIALDDVGSDTATEAMMSLVRPDVIKLDRGVVHDGEHSGAAEVVSAVHAEADRTGAVILAEGIETTADAERARRLGATLGQGWLLGRPGGLPRHVRPPRKVLPQVAIPSLAGATPFEIARLKAAVSRTDRHTLRLLSQAIEDGFTAVEPTVLLISVPHAGRFDAPTRERYARLAQHGILTAAYAEGMPAEPGPHIRGCAVAPGDPLTREWNVLVIGSFSAHGLFARAIEGQQDGYEVVITNDRSVILAAARPLLARLTPAYPVTPDPLD